MVWKLNWIKAKGFTTESPPIVECGALQAEPASVLLGTPRRKKLLEHIWQRTSLSRKQFDQLYFAPLKRFAELVQHLPASETHHHAYPGGMLDHGLEIVAYALKMRQSYLLPLGTSPETQAAQTEAWTAAVAYAALLHDIGKIAVDVEVDLVSGDRWHPWHGPIEGGYRFRFAKGREYKLHGAAAGLVYTQILSAKILDWLSTFPELWAALIYVLAGQYEHAGILGELVIQADRASVAQELGGNPARAMHAPKHSLQRQLVKGLRHLVAEQLKLNQPAASDGWLTQEALWLVSKTVADKLRAHLLSQGVEGYFSDKLLRSNSQRSYKVACGALIRWMGDCLVEQIDRKAILLWRKEVLGVTIKPVMQRHPALPLLGPALARQLQELPGASDGLSLTQRLTLRILATQGELPAGKLFSHLTMSDEPLPYLGDLMFYALLRPLLNAPRPLIDEQPADDGRQRHLRLTALGERVLQGQANWLDQAPAERWVGGVRIAADQAPWVVSGDGKVGLR